MRVKAPPNMGTSTETPVVRFGDQLLMHEALRNPISTNTKPRQQVVSAGSTFVGLSSNARRTTWECAKLCFPAPAILPTPRAAELRFVIGATPSRISKGPLLGLRCNASNYTFDVPELWAQSLHSALAHKVRTHIEPLVSNRIRCNGVLHDRAA